jgi:hypothetical protein
LEHANGGLSRRAAERPTDTAKKEDGHSALSWREHDPDRDADVDSADLSALLAVYGTTCE